MKYKISTYLGSAISIGFGIWHFFIPTIWKWYSYIDPLATELILAVSITNFFFSLLMVLIGVMNILLVSNHQTSRHTMLTLWTVNIVLWLCRVIIQLITPQGTSNHLLQYGMLAAFISVLIMYTLAIYFYVKSSVHLS